MLASLARAKNYFLFILLSACLLATHLATSLHAQSSKVPEYYIKAAFMANFARLVEWPKHNRNTTNLSLCVMDSTVFGQALNSINGKKIHGKNLLVSTCNSKTDFDRIQILFLNSPDIKARKDLLARCREKPVLTIGESPGFAQNEGMINFYKAKNRIRFEINRKRAEKAGLKISSRLLKLAKIVSDSKQE